MSYFAVADLSDLDRRILDVLAKRHGATVNGILASEIAEEVHLSGGNLGSRLSSLVHRGLICGRRCRDGHRGNLWRLTSEAYKELPWRP